MVLGIIKIITSSVILRIRDNCLLNFGDNGQLNPPHRGR